MDEITDDLALAQEPEHPASTASGAALGKAPPQID